MNGELVGHWNLAPTYEEVAYAPSWINSDRGRPLSLSLPFQPGNLPLRGPAVRAYFENLLPDSKPILDRIARRYHTGSTDAFDLLEQIGRDCAGAIQIMPADRAPGDVRRIDGEALDDAGVARELVNAITPQSQIGQLDDSDEFRISIAGAQEKTALLWHKGRWMRPHGTTPTTHILKLPLGTVGGRQLMDMSGSVENEWLCAKIVRAYKIPIAECHIGRFGNAKALVVTRFDRQPSPDGNWFMRLPQEDLCQATGTPPARKYESDGGPGMDSILTLLNGSNEREADRNEFLKVQILFWMLAATDGHAKNFSIRLLPGGEFKLTPLYDVLSAYPVIGSGANLLPFQDAKLAMSVRSKHAHRRLQDIQRRHWNSLARRNGVGESAEDIITNILDETPNVVDRVRRELPMGFPDQVAEKIFVGMQKAASKLANMPAK